MKPFSTSLIAGALVVATVGLTACDSSPRRVDSSERVTTLDLNVQDVESFSAEMADQLLLSPFFSNTASPIRIKLEQFRNNTTKTNLTSDQVLAPVRQKLLNSGKVQFYAGATAGRSNAESGIVSDYQKIREAEAGAGSQGFDYVLNLTLGEDRVKQSGVSQSTYILTLKVLNVNNASYVYEAYETIDKQKG